MNHQQGENTMEKERIAELREEIARNKATGYHDEGIGTFDSPTMDAALDTIEATQAELATAREALLESLEARRTSEAEGGALNQLNNEIDRLRAELATLRGHRQASEAAFGEWFEAHFADWLRMRGGFRHDDVRHFRDSLLTAWSAALRGQVGGVVPEPTAEEWREIAENARSADMVDFLAGASAYGLWLRGKALPSSRVAGEGQTLVSQEYLYKLERIAADVAQAELEPRATKGAG